jgi:hypothetical protein
MRGRVVVLILISLFSVSAASFAQCTYTPLYSGQYRSSLLDLAIDGNDLWTATSYGVTLYDRSVDPPSLVTSIAVPGITRIVRVANGLAYVGSGSAIHVIAKSGASLRIASSTDTGGTVNDLVVLAATIYAATSNGLVQFDLFDPQKPIRNMNSFPTASPNVLSLALAGPTLYAANGGGVDVFSVSIPTLPQKTATIASLPGSSSVRLSGSKLFVSDGRQTDVFLNGGSVKAVSTLFGTSAFTPINSDVIFAAGNDHTLRAVDFTTVGSPVELFETTLATVGGTINRILAMQIAGGRLYAAAGDAGLLTYDVSAFTTPFPVHGYGFGSMTSILSLGSKVYATPSGTSIIEYTQSASGQLTQARQWTSQTQHVYDGTQTGLLISASGATLTYWLLTSTTPTAISSVTFAKSVTTAVLVGGNMVYAVLADGTMASADMSQVSPVASPFAVPGATPAAIARSGSAAVVSDVRNDGTTQLLFYSSLSPAATPQRATVSGLATGGLALGGTTAAIFTFSGINLVDFSTSSPSPVVIPGSNAFIPQSLTMVGTTLIEVTDRALLVWDTRTLKLTRQLSLPADAVAVHASPDAQSDVADVATTSGLTTAAYRATTQTPTLLATTGANNYYKKVSATPDRMYLFDSRGVDIFSTASAAPHFVASVRASALINFAASSDTLFTLSSSGVVASYSRDGSPLAQITLSGTSDTQWLAIATVNGAPWVSFSQGCLSGGCQKITLVLDPRQLTQTASLTGGVTDVAVSGTRAFGLFDLPSEIRAYDISDPLHPSMLATRSPDGTRAPESITTANGALYVIGDRLYSYDAVTLASTSTQLDAWTADPTGALTYIDQRIRADGGCAVVTGRTFTPQLFTLPQLAASAPIAAPGAVKSLASQNGRLLLLTDYSLEIWSTGTTAPKQRRRAVH